MSVPTTTGNDISKQVLPWYRYGWPWFLISIPLVSVCLGSVMLYLAFNANNSLVVDDYYKEGKAYNLRIERDRFASLLGLNATVTESSEGLILELDQESPIGLPQSLESDALSAQQSFTMPGSLQLRWVHVTQEARDGEARLEFIGATRYIGKGVSLPLLGKFRLHIEPASDIEGQTVLPDRDWRLTSVLTGFENRQSIEIPAPVPAKVFTRAMFQ